MWFSNIGRSLNWSLPCQISVVALKTFFACFLPFQFLTQIDDFAKAIGPALSQFFPILKQLLFFE